MTWNALTLDAAASSLAVAGAALYVLIPWVRQHARRWLRVALHNRRAYLLAFECSAVFLSVWGVLGKFVEQYPRVVGAMAAQGVDLPAVVDAAGLHLDLRTLGWLRLGLLGMAVGSVTAGLLCRQYGRREVFPDIRQAVEYAVRKAARPLYAVSYVAVRGGPVVTTAIRDPADEARWVAWAKAFPAAMAGLSADLRPARQGENVRVVYEAGSSQTHYYRFGAHAYLVASASPPGGKTRRRAESEVRHLIWAIRALASAHGADG
jgi:hypothetical protein